MVRTSAVRSIHTKDAEASEALMISALIDDGRFLPVRWGVSIEDCECYTKVWQFCETYQAAQGEAPGWALIRNRFPDFPELRGVGCAFAAGELARDAQSRRMRIAMSHAADHLRSGDIDEAQAALAGITIGRPGGKPGDSVWELPEVVDENPISPTPYPTLDKATMGGIRNSELWYLCGLAGHGKTMVLCEYVGKFLAEGLNVSYLSAEVPTRTINKRVRRALATPAELTLLDAKKDDYPDRDAIKKAIGMQRDRITGDLTVYDSSHGPITPATVRYHCAQADLVVVDHIGLMTTPDGKRAIDDWRLYGVISNYLLEEKNATGTTIMAAAQLNRTADNGSSRAPSSNTVGGAYQLVQDADVLVTMKRMGKRAMVHGAKKVREGSEATWYSDFDVKAAKFGEIKQDRAEDLKAEFPLDDD